MLPKKGDNQSVIIIASQAGAYFAWSHSSVIWSDLSNDNKQGLDMKCCVKKLANVVNLV